MVQVLVEPAQVQGNRRLFAAARPLNLYLKRLRRRDAWPIARAQLQMFTRQKMLKQFIQQRAVRVGTTCSGQDDEFIERGELWMVVAHPRVMINENLEPFMGQHLTYRGASSETVCDFLFEGFPGCVKGVSHGVSSEQMSDVTLAWGCPAHAVDG
ncbi:hypothetical protein D3C81_1805370 [compost metagenome]